MADIAPNADSQPATAAGGSTTGQLSIEKIYIKDLSLENPGAPQSFQLTDAPQIEVGLRTRGEQVAPDVYECVLTLTVTARSADKTVFLVEASQAGVFTIRGVPPNQLQAVLGVHCPTVLFPYARATADPATVMYDAPSARAKPLFVYGRDIPVETLVAVEGWTKIRDAAGTIGWMQSGMLTDKRMVVVRAAAADVRAAADDGSPVV